MINLTQAEYYSSMYEDYLFDQGDFLSFQVGKMTNVVHLQIVRLFIT